MNAICAGLGGFVGPIVVGNIVKSLKSFESAAIAMASFIFAAGLIIAVVNVWERRNGIIPGSSIRIPSSGSMRKDGGGKDGKDDDLGKLPLPARGGTMSTLAAAAAAPVARAARAERAKGVNAA
jgi:hypothetical protein